MDLSPTARRRGLAALLAASFLSSAGFFGVIPLIAVHYVDDLGWSAGSIGLMLAVRQFTQQGLSVFSGMLADRWGAKGLILAGMLIRVAGFLLLGLAGNYALLMLSGVVVALGGGLFESPKAAAIATLTDDDNRQRYYALTGAVGGFGVVLGTQAGALLIRADFAVVAIAGAISFLSIWLVLVIFLPSVRVATGEHGPAQGMAFAVRDRPFMTYNGLMMGYWFMWTQFYVALPLAATAIAGTTSAVSWIFAVNSAATLILGFPLPRILDRRLAPLPMLILGTLLTAVGLAGIGWAGGVPALLVGVLVFSIGTLVVRPAEQTVTAGLAVPATRGSYYGVAAASLAIGGGLGNYLGGVIYDVGLRADLRALPWLTFAAVGVVTAVGLFRLGATAGRHDSPALALVHAQRGASAALAARRARG